MTDLIVGVMCAILSGAFMAVPIGLSARHDLSLIMGVPIALLMMAGLGVTAWRFFF